MRRMSQVLLLSLLFNACDSPATGPEDGDAEHTEEHDETEEPMRKIVAVSAEQRTALGIEVATAAPGRIDAPVELLGEVEANGDHLAHIVPRFAGIVREVRKVAGDSVRAGDVLAVIESSESLVRYELKTLIGGVVLAKHLTIGEAVGPDKQAFVIADLSTVWVDLSVYQKDLDEIAVGQEVRIHAVQHGPDADGTISYVTPVVDRETRTATARVLLPNPERKWLPGMFVTGHTLDERGAEVAIAPSALQTIDGKPVVFVETPDGFVPRDITIGRSGETLVEVLAGLSSGERFVSENSFLLKAELAKGEAGHEH
jgi:cobalt-zinc-cadmium efflux system membrane fusion protein